MLTREQARALVVADLADGTVDIMDEHTIERSWGWMFFYQSKRFIETGDHLQGLVGNAPYLVNKETGAFGFTGTAYTPGELIEMYENELNARS